MKLAPALAVGLATVGASLLVAAPTAAANQATPGTCTITAQPWDGRSYALTAVVDGTPTPLITRQSGLLEGQTSWTFTTPSGVVGDPTGVTEIWWAARNPDRQQTAADFYDILHVTPGCTFAEGYHAIPGKADSVAIRVETLPYIPTTTTTAAPTTTTEPAPTTTAPTPQTTFATTTAPTPQTTFATTPFASTTTTEQPPTGTTSSTVSMPTTTIEVDEPLRPEPTTTAPAPPPTVPVPSTTSTTTAVELFTATSVEQATGTLPMTGWGFASALYLAGGLLAGGLALRPLRRRMQRAEVQS